MEEMAKLGEFALKLERYKYNMIASTSWIIYGGIFASFFVIGDALMGLFGFNPVVLATSIVGSVVVCVYIHYRFTKLIGKFKQRSSALAVFGIAFALFYFAVPLFIKNGTNTFYAAYYSTAWYPALGISHVVLWYIWQRKDKDLVTKPSLLTGVLSLITSIPIMYNVFFVANVSNAINLGFLTIGLMLAIYLASGLWGFYKSYKVIF